MTFQGQPHILQIAAEVPLPAEAGGKARGLKLIASARLALPSAWVVLGNSLPAELAALAQELRERGIRSLAVRSSAVGEDDATHSFAGVHETRLAVPVDDLERIVPEVALSALSERARAYRKHLGLPAPAGPCAVIVQEMVAGECSGVAFGVGERLDRLVVEAVEGLGEPAVAGRVRPEAVELRRIGREWDIHRRTPRCQPTALVVTDSGLSEEVVPPDRQTTQVLDAATARGLAEGVEALQALAGSRLDVEWTYRSGTLSYLQARRQTRPLAAALPPGQVWTRANVRDVLPEIPSAFTRSLIEPCLGPAERDFVRAHGISTDDDIPFFTFVHGRPVFNERVFLVADAIGVARESIQASFGGSEEARNDVMPPVLTRALRHPLVLLRAISIAVNAERRARARRLPVGVPTDVAAAQDEQLLESIYEAFTIHLRAFLQHVLAVASALAAAESEVLTVLRHRPAPVGDLSRLCAAGDGSVSTRQLQELVSIALAARESHQARRFFAGATPERGLPAEWEEQLPGELWASVRQWLSRYGHRGPFETDLAYPRYGDDLGILARALAPLVVSERAPESPEANRARREREAAEAWKDVENSVGPWGRLRIRQALPRVKRLMALRESLRSEMVGMSHRLRHAALALGQRLVARGRLERPEDVWHLGLGEVRTALAHPDFDATMAVRKERSRLAGWRRLEVPNRFSSEEAEHLAASQPSSADPAPPAELVGNGISPGIAEGNVCVLMSPDQAGRMEAGAILVAPATEPAWSPLFARAVGLVVEIGGTLSHAAIVAREYAIPCVSNVAGATRQLQDGDRIRLDGSRGTVTVISRAHGGSRPSRPETD